jgi:hypothetical protein
VRALLIAAVALLSTTVTALDASRSGSLERPFTANGRVSMDLSAGDYRIVGGPESSVRIDWSVRDAESLSKVRATADVRDKALSITTDGPSNRNLTFTIRLPHQSDLYVRLTAGDIRIEGIRGNKDVSLRAGDMRIEIGSVDEYNKVDASLWAGDLNASAFQIYKEGLFRSFDWSGKGPYQLRAHLMAGDLYLYAKAAEAR